MSRNAGLPPGNDKSTELYQIWKTLILRKKVKKFCSSEKNEKNFDPKKKFFKKRVKSAEFPRECQPWKCVTEKISKICDYLAEKIIHLKYKLFL